MSVSSSMARRQLDLVSSPFLGPLPRALLEGKGLELLQPLRFAPLPEALAKLDAEPPAVDRRELAAALSRSNAELGHPAADELANRLAESTTRVVVTGQQPGLLGGPLYTLTKAVAAAKIATELERRGMPAVAVFWVATEDHDYDEVASVCLGPDEPRRFGLGEDPSPLAPLGDRRLGPAITELLEAADLDRPYGERLRLLARWYRPEAGFGDSFAGFLIHLMGRSAPLFLDAQDPVLKTLQRPWHRRLIEERKRVAEVLDKAHDAVEAAGFPLQVTPQPGTSPLFVVDPDRDQKERRRIVWEEEEGFSLRGGERSGSVADLLQLVDRHPEAIGPGVLARPVLQDAVLGTALQVLGPGEVAYMAQAAALYRLLDVSAPVTTLRPQVLLVDPRQGSHLDGLAELGLELGELLGEEGEIERLLAARQGADFVRPAAERIDALLVELSERARELEEQLSAPGEKTRRHVAKALERFACRVDTAAARRLDVERGRIQRLREAMLPEGRLQERMWTTAHFLGLFGEELVPSLLEALTLDSRSLQLLVLDRGLDAAPDGASVASR